MSQEVNPQDIHNFYQEKLQSYGATPLGVGWNSKESQEIRFAQLCKVIDPAQPFSINDYGCGYGALLPYLKENGFQIRQYNGFDILETAIVQAQQRFQDEPDCTFTIDQAQLPTADYTVTSGIFNVKFGASDEAWTVYVLDILERMNALSRKGFSFNMLTQYSDAEYMRPDHYYPDPCFYFDVCKRRFSRNVALLHDYILYDFTILVRK